MRRRFCWRRPREAAVFFLFLTVVGLLYRALPSAETDKADPWAPRVVVVFRDFGERDLTVLAESVRQLHSELPELEVLIMSQRSSLLASKVLRFSSTSPVRLLPLHPGNATPAFNQNLLTSTDYFLFVPPALHLSRKLVAGILETFWRVASVSRSVGLAALPLAGFPPPLCLRGPVTGFDADEEELKYPHPGAPPRSTTEPPPRTAQLRPVECSPTEEGGCCACQALWSGEASASVVLVARGPGILPLPRPWLSPAPLALSLQLSLLSHAAAFLCPSAALSHNLPPPLTSPPDSPAQRKLHLQRILALFGTKLLR